MSESTSTSATPPPLHAGLTSEQFIAAGRERFGHAERLHRAVYRRLMLAGRAEPAEIEEVAVAARLAPGLVERYKTAIRIQLPEVVSHVAIVDPRLGTTTKYVLGLADGSRVEAVLLPMGRAEGHHSLCISTQVGCRMGCTFCHTARMGLVRNLSAEEIVGQYLAVRAHSGIAARNVVFMGMGEPLDNPEAVAQAVSVLLDRSGLALSGDHVTVSTVGRVDALARWQELGLDRVNLAVSLTAVDDDVRSALMPINRTMPVAALREAVVGLRLRPRRRILFACVVIPGVTDRPEQVDRLATWLEGLPALVNLIPYNPIPSQVWRAPDDSEIVAVRDRLLARGIPVRLRLTRGASAMAACGQLGSPRRRQRVTDAG